jgi:hypothetical protein
VAVWDGQRAHLSTTTSREQLAKELAERNDCCARVDGDGICLRRPKQHEGECQYERIERVIPIK